MFFQQLKSTRPNRMLFGVVLVVIALFMLTTVQAGDNLRLKVDTVTLNNPSGSGLGSFTTVMLQQSYTNPVVLVWPTNENPEPSTVRIQNVTSNSFDVAVIEPPNNFGGSSGVSAMDIDYIVIEAGVYNLGGTLLEAGTFDTTLQQGGALPGGATIGEVDLNFANTYVGEPILLTQVQTVNNEPGIGPSVPSTPFLEVSVRNITNVDADVALERAQTQSNTVVVNETIGYLAMQAGVVSSFNASAGVVDFQSILTTNSVTGNCFTQPIDAAVGTSPLVVGSQSTRDGGDGGWAQRCNLGNTGSIGVQVDEDQDLDAERGHTNEEISLLVFSQVFDADVSGVRFESGSTTTLPVSAGTLGFTTVVFSKSFPTTPLIFPLPTDQGDNPAALRVRNVTPSGFQIAQVNPPGAPGAHPSMDVDYIAVAPGMHLLPGGVEIEAGSITTASFQANPAAGSSWATLNFTGTYAVQPSVLFQVQTVNSEPMIDPSFPSIPWLVVAAANGTATSINVALERAEVTAGTIVAETIGYIAIPDGTQNTFLDDLGNEISYEGQVTGNSFVGWTDSCNTVPYLSAFGATPKVVAHQSTRNGNNGGWFRRCSISNSTIGLVVDEDTAADSERSHTTESASIIAFSESFEACLEPEIGFTKTFDLEIDPFNCDTATRVCTNPPKNIPGSEQLYTLSFINSRSGASTSDTFVIVDELPEEVELFVGDLDGSGAPFIFNDGNNPAAVDGEDSGLGFTYINASSTTDSIDFSTDGVNFNYTPVPDSDSFDENITHIRFTPSGRLLPANTGVQPQLNLQFRVRVR